MGLRLVRQTSDTPNITNKDDTVMTRYAYGGYNGVVKGFGEECGYTTDGSIFKILSGRIVIDGWEIDIDGAGFEIDLRSSGSQIHAVYAEINVLNETVGIYSRYGSSMPDIDKGDDLTEVPNGTARLLLYQVSVAGNLILFVSSKFSVIQHLFDYAKTIAENETKIDKVLSGETTVPKAETSKLIAGTTLITHAFTNGVAKNLKLKKRAVYIGVMAESNINREFVFVLVTFNANRVFATFSSNSYEAMYEFDKEQLTIYKSASSGDTLETWSQSGYFYLKELGVF